MKKSWIVLAVACITMLLGTCWIEQVSIDKDAVTISTYGYWGFKGPSIRVIPTDEIQAVDVQPCANRMHKGGTPYGVGIRTRTERVLLNSYVFNSVAKACKYSGHIEEGLKTGSFFSRGMPNGDGIYASLVLIVLWFLFDRKIFQ